MTLPDNLSRRVEGQGPWLHPRKTGLPVSVFIGLVAFVAAFTSPAPAEFVPGPGFDVCTEKEC